MQFNFAHHLNTDLPEPEISPWRGFPQFNFVGGHNDPASLDIAKLRDACDSVLAREGNTLATYNLQSGPQGYLPLRHFLVDKLKRYSAIECSTDQILLTSGSLQAIDLINTAMLKHGDTVIVEESNYGGILSRLRQLDVNMISIPVDQQGMQVDRLANTLEELKHANVRPRYLYTIPTVHNPTGAILPLERRQQLLRVAEHYDLPIFEDECYADLVWQNTRPPALRGLDQHGRVVHIGSFSKTIAPALRVGYIVADWALLGQLLALKTDAGSGALEQMLLAEYCTEFFDMHLAQLNQNLQKKLDALTNALEREFGTSAHFNSPQGGIFLWLRLPESINTTELTRYALDNGIAINPGAEWSLQPDAKNWLRICFANPEIEVIEEGIAKLADVCFKHFGEPARSGNRSRL